ncbi:MAG: hypothetical protein RSD49_08410 [Hafnia sp.]
MFIDIDARDWAFAALLGEARRRSNDSIRKSSRDRGNVKNIHVDLMGSISEILALKYLREVLTIQERKETIKAMFRPEGGGGKLGADLSLSQRGVVLDVKTFDCQDNKRFFAINSTKHGDLEGACNGYLCIICPKYATQAYIVDYVPFLDVSGWEKKALGSYGDSSYNLNIHKFLSQYASGLSLTTLKSGAKYDREVISREVNSDATRAIFQRLFVNSDRFIRTSKSKAANA